MNIHILHDPKWSQQRFVQRLAGERIAQIRFPEFLVFQKLLSSLKGMVFAHNKKQEPQKPSSSPPLYMFWKDFHNTTTTFSPLGLKSPCAPPCHRVLPWPWMLAPHGAASTALPPRRVRRWRVRRCRSRALRRPPARR